MAAADAVLLPCPAAAGLPRADSASSDASAARAQYVRPGGEKLPAGHLKAEVVEGKTSEGPFDSVVPPP